MQLGFGQLSDEEVLTILIRSGTKQASASEIARNILEYAEGIENLGSLTVLDLCKIKGINKVKALEILALIEVQCRILKPRVNQIIDLSSSFAVLNWLKLTLGYQKQEHLLALYLNVRNALLGYRTLFIGTVDRSVIHPREIFKQALLHSASKIILVHNHPGGSTEPSIADCDVTRLIADAGFVMGIEIVDHLIVTIDTYHSMRESHEFLFTKGGG